MVGAALPCALDRCTMGKRAGVRKRGQPSIKRVAVPFVNAYVGPCAACGLDRTCEACTQTGGCTRCTAQARCGSCRNVHSSAHRRAGLQLSARGVPPLRPPIGAADGASIDLPRTRGGLNHYYHLPLPPVRFQVCGCSLHSTACLCLIPRISFVCAGVRCVESIVCFPVTKWSRANHSGARAWLIESMLRVLLRARCGCLSKMNARRLVLLNHL